MVKNGHKKELTEHELACYQKYRKNDKGRYAFSNKAQIEEFIKEECKRILDESERACEIAKWKCFYSNHVGTYLEKVEPLITAWASTPYAKERIEPYEWCLKNKPEVAKELYATEAHMVQWHKDKEKRRAMINPQEMCAKYFARQATKKTTVKFDEEM